MMNFSLLIEGISKYLFGLILVCLLLFVPAGSIYYFNGWLFICLLFIPMFIVGVLLFIFNPKLLESRLNARESEDEEKGVILLSGLMFILGFVFAGLSYRFKWLVLPDVVVYISSFIFFIIYLLYAEILRENEYLLRTVGVVSKQKVVDRGMYGIVRHPMYLVTIILFLMIPLILGSLISFCIFLVYPFIIIKRINNEEEVLEKDLKGYKDYQKKVRYKLFPGVW